MKRFSVIATVLGICAMLFTPAVSIADGVITGAYSWIGSSDWSPDGRYIVFSADNDIMMIDLTTNVIRNLTENIDTICYFPIFSSDGTEVMFTHYSNVTDFYDMPDDYSDYGLRTDAINISTGDHRIVMDDAMCMSMSSDGRYAVYIKRETDIAVYDFITGGEKELNLDEAVSPPFFTSGIATPFFAEDNQHIIVNCQTMNTVPTWDNIMQVNRLFKINIETGEGEVIGNTDYQGARISSDFSRIAATERVINTHTEPFYPISYVDQNTGEMIVDYGEVLYRGQFFVVDPDTGDYMTMSYENYYCVDGPQDVYRCDEYSGEYVAVDSSRFPKTRTIDKQTWAVAVLDLGTGESQRIVNAGSYQTKCPCWSPNGTKLCYALDNGDYYSIYIYDFVLKAHKLVMLGSDAEQVVVEENAIPASFELSGNYPNPFNPTTTIDFNLHNTGDVRMDVYNVMGQSVRELVSGRMTAGAHSVVWDGRDDSGDAVSSGVYMCRLKMGEQVRAIRMLLTK